jgi:hypothetical protein
MSHDYAAGLARGFQQVRLSREESWNLQDVANFRGGCGVRGLVNVGRNGHLQVVLDLSEDAQSFLESRAPKRLDGGAIRLVVRSLVDVGHPRIGGDSRHLLGDFSRMCFALNNARPSDQKKRISAAQAKRAERNLTRHSHSEH